MSITLYHLEGPGNEKEIIGGYGLSSEDLIHPTLLESSFPLTYTSKKVEEFMEKQNQRIIKGLAVPPHIIKGESTMEQLDHDLNNNSGVAFQFLDAGQQEYLKEANKRGFSIQVFSEEGWLTPPDGPGFFRSNIYRVDPEDIRKDLLDHNLNNFIGKKWDKLSFPEHEYLKNAEKAGYTIERWNDMKSKWCTGKYSEDSRFHPKVAYRVSLREIEQENEIGDTSTRIYADLNPSEKAYLHRMYEEGYTVEFSNDSAWITAGGNYMEWHPRFQFRVTQYYYYVDQLGAVQSTRDEGLFSDRQHKKVGNYYTSERAAKAHADLVKRAYKGEVEESRQHERGSSSRIGRKGKPYSTLHV